MSIRPNSHPLYDFIVPRHVLLSVSDKTGLDVLVPGIVKANPDVILYSTGGTAKVVKDILGTERARNYCSVEQFLGMSEMEGGLVKTLHPKIHAGLLSERGNPEHERFLLDDMKRMTGTEGVYFDALVVNFYPFQQTVNREDCTPEMARGNIDIGGPAMVRSGSKNWPSVAVLSWPTLYGEFLHQLEHTGGTNLAHRFRWSQLAFIRVEEYDRAISGYLGSCDFGRDVKPGLAIAGEQR